MKKDISIVIVTYNSEDLIEDCIDSLFKYNDKHVALEIIVVDNSGEERSKLLFDFLKRKYEDELILIRNPINGGYGQGNNLGIKASSSDLVCIMNPDIRLIEPLFKDVLEIFESDRKIGVVGLSQLGGNNFSFYFKPEYFVPFFSNIATFVANRLNLFSGDLMFTSGAFVFLRKTAFYSIGLYDENIFLYTEESDISNRFSRNGFKTKFYAKRKYLHLVGDRAEWSDFTYDNWLKSKVYYFEKFSFNKVGYFKKLLIEIDVKIVLFKILGKKDRISSLERFKNKIYNLIHDRD